jgi:hypothetical protein
MFPVRYELNSYINVRRYSVYPGDAGSTFRRNVGKNARNLRETRTIRSLARLPGTET